MTIHSFDRTWVYCVVLDDEYSMYRTLDADDRNDAMHKVAMISEEVNRDPRLECRGLVGKITNCNTLTVMESI